MMYRKAKMFKIQESHTAKRGKGGFTLVELSIVLALLAILMSMVVSFSVLMDGFTAQNRAEYGFLEDHAKLKETLCSWANENDVSGSVFTITDATTLTVVTVDEATGNETRKSVSFDFNDENTLVLSLGDEDVVLADTDGVTFSTYGKLIKCVSCHGEQSRSFVFSLHNGTIMVGGG